MDELDFIDRLKQLTTHPAARGLEDDVAVIPFGRQKLVMTHDMMVEGVHFLSSANPDDVAWKLVAVNLSDLAAKGARPLGIIMGYGKTGNSDWDAKFVEGLKQAIARFGVPLLGGDTVSMADCNKRALGLTAFGESKGHIVPARDGAQPGHHLYVTGTIGDAWGGLQLATGRAQASDVDAAAKLLKAHNRPEPLLEDGRRLSSLVSAMMDISDGLLLDARRIADTSGVAVEIDLERIPLSGAFAAVFGDSPETRQQAAAGGDDYQLLLTASPETVLPVPVTRIGRCKAGSGLNLVFGDNAMPMPANLGYIHR